MGANGAVNASGANGGVVGANGAPMVFISYRHSAVGDHLAESFRSRIADAGFGVYIDKAIGWGSAWVSGVREALERAHCLLLLLSREAAESEFVWAEVELARQISDQRDGRPLILPVRVLLPPDHPLPYHLVARLYNIQYRNWASDEDTERLARELIDLLRSHGVAAAPAAREPVRAADPVDPLAAAQGPGGAIDVNSPVYVLRAADDVIHRQVALRRSLTTLKAPRQMGKTSMLFRALSRARADGGLRAVFIDFQALPRSELADVDALWRGIARRIAAQLRLKNWQPVEWDDRAGHEFNLEALLERHVFAGDGRDILICFDEADRLFGTPIRDEFFGSVRALFNLGAMESTWSKVRWALVTSTEPSFFITDVRQSPFNVGRHIHLSQFSPHDVAGLAEHMGLRVDAGTIAQLHRYLGGHPYLTHRVFYEAATERPADLDKAILAALRPERFHDHLHRFLIHLQADRGMAATLREVLAGKRGGNPLNLERLRAAGLIRQAGPDNAPAAALYGDFFARELAP